MQTLLALYTPSKYKLNINFKFSITIPYRNLSALYKYIFKFISFVSNSRLNVVSYLSSGMLKMKMFWELYGIKIPILLLYLYNYANFFD